MVAVVQEGLLVGPGGGLLFDPPFDLAKHACHVAGEVVLYQPLDGIGVFFQPVEQLVQHFCLVLGRSRLEQGELLLAPLEGDHTHAEVVSPRSEEHTSELQSLMRISYAVLCLKIKTLRQSEYRTTAH